MSVKDFFRKHERETCVIIGNGPSLDITPLEELGRKYVTFGSNKIYRKPFYPTYYCIIDELMLWACLPLPSGILTNSEIFLRAEAPISGNNYIYPIVANGFSLDASNFVVMGGTVTYALLQLAFYMDFETVLLVGVDHKYPRTGNKPMTKFISKVDKDPDHFTCADGKAYFDMGKEFNAPQLDGARISYKIAKELYTERDKRIVNLTPDSALDVFEKGSFEEWLTHG